MFRFNFETAASSEAKPNGFAASINKTIYNLKVQRTIKLKTENFNRKNVRFILFQLVYLFHDRPQQLLHTNRDS